MKEKKLYMVARVVGLPGYKTYTRTPARLKLYRRLKIKGMMQKTYRVKTTLSFLVRVPVVMTTIPEVPDAINVGKNVFVKTHDSPLTYQWVSILSAQKV